jgi:hypothetical protein
MKFRSLLLALCIFSIDCDMCRAATAQPEKLEYSSIEIQSAQDPEFAYWKDEAKEVDWQSPRKPTVFRHYFFNSDGRRLLATMLSAAGVCGIRECPVRLFTDAGEQVAQISVCDQSEFHAISADRLSFVACGAATPIPQAGPAGSLETSDVHQYSHNGSIVRASFYKDGDVRIEYDEVRKGLPNSLRGEVLFRGTSNRQGNIVGTAYTFKGGCEPAPYAVQGKVGRGGKLVLAGDAPIRDANSCNVTGFSAQSRSARLTFFDVEWDQ